MTRIVNATVNGATEYRVYYNQELVARFEKRVYAELFENRLKKSAYILINEDNDIVCAFDCEPSVEEVQYQLEESYSMTLTLQPLQPYGSIYNHIEVYGDNFHEIVQIVKTRLI
jgi:hypothetical protein